MMRGRLIGLGALLLVASVASPFVWMFLRPPAPPEVTTEGLDAEVAEVVSAARAGVVGNQRSAAAWGYLGRALLANETYPETSLLCFLEAERLDPDNPRWPYLAGLGLLNLSRQSDAVPKLERAVVLCDRSDEKNAAPRLRLAETLVALGQDEAAEAHVQNVLSTDAQNLRARYDLGMLASFRGDWEQARAHFLTCVGSPQARKKACAQLAAICERLSDKANADHYASLAARLPKDFNWSDPFVAEHAHLSVRKRDRYRLVEQMEAEGQFAAAAQVLTKLVERYPDDYLPHLMMGRILPQMGEFDRVEQHFARALELAPDKFQVHYLRGLVLLRRGEAIWFTKDGDHKKALALFEASATAARQVLQQRPDYGFAHMSLGLSLKYLGRRAEAIAAFRDAVHCNPEYADIHLFLGATLAEDGKLSEARYYLEQALVLAVPSDRRPRAALDQYFPRNDPKSKT
jgi:tetratricopeptide (TPR) repeat protein